MDIGQIPTLHIACVYINGYNAYALDGGVCGLGASQRMVVDHLLHRR